MKKQYFSNVWNLVKFIFKHNKWRLIIWVLALLLFDMYALTYMHDMYPTQEARDTYKLILENPAMLAMFGKGYGFDNYTHGVFYANLMYVWLGLFNGVMAIMLVSKQLRGEEEEGRYEMVRSLPVGRNSYLLASMIVMTITFVVFIILKPITFLLVNVESIDFASSLNFSIGLGLIGIFFTMLTAVISQIFRSNRSVMGISFAAFLGLYLIFSIGVLSSDILLWLSPFQWMVASQSFVNNFYWPLSILFLVSIGLGVLALYLSSIRDLDAGLIVQKTKQHKTKKYIKGPFGFTAILSKTIIIGWLIAMFILGASYGSIFGDLETFISGNDLLSNMLPENSDYSTTVLFMGFIITVLGIISTIPAILVMNKLSSEESKGRMEIIFSHSVKRSKIAISYFVLSLLIGLGIMFFSAFGLYVASSAVMADPISFGTILSAIMVYVPSLVVFLGISLLFTGYFPKQIWIVWLYLGFGFFVVYIGALIGIGDVITNLSPFGYAPQLPVEKMNWGTQILILIAGVSMAFLGLSKYQKRSSL